MSQKYLTQVFAYGHTATVPNVLFGEEALLQAKIVVVHLNLEHWVFLRHHLRRPLQ